MLDEIDLLVNARIEADGPGVAVAVIRGGEVLHAKGYGLANLEWGQPAAPDTIFGIGSLTKPFTAMAIMLLEREGKLRLDDPLTAYLPDYLIGDRTITLTHLLTHTSGIVNFVTQPGFWEGVAQVPRPPERLRELFETLPHNFVPGERYSYSNSGYCLLGLIIERLSGMPYGRFIEERVFGPLGMTHSRYLDDATVIPRRATGYIAHDGRYESIPPFSMSLTYAAGGLASTLEDLIACDASLRDHRLLDEETWRRMTTPLRLNDGRTEDYGLGWALSEFRGRHAIHHAGGVPGFTSFFGHIVDDDITLITLSNRSGFDGAGLARDICGVALSLNAAPHVASAVSSTATARMVGTYSDAISTFTVARRERGLRLSGDFNYTLEAISDTAARAVDDPDITVTFDGVGADGYERAKVVVPFYWVSGYRVADEAER